jgi:hypothetical protein
MSKNIVRIWGVLSLLAPLVFIGAGLAISQIPPMDSDAAPNYDQLNAILAAANIYIFGLAIASIIFAFKIPNFPGSAKAGWTVLLLAFHAFAVPIFWYIHIRPSANE